LVNGNKTSLAEHLEILPVICWSSGDLEILLGPPSERRRFIDRGVVGLRPTAIRDLTRYRQALHEKRQLLLHRGDGLEAWNRVLADAAASLIRLRASFVEQLQVALAEVIEICELGFPPIGLHYRCSPPQGFEGAEAIYRALEEAEGRERRRERPLIGPHRDELVILWDGHGIRRVASAGERKALGLALLAASGMILDRAGRQPIFLLDDADTELDIHRLNALWRFFGEVPQLFATSNRPQIWERFPIANRWHLHQGKMKAV
jgi:DNA replication and repair protein RecF